MFGPIRAIVVDNDPAHLLTISAGLSAAGIPCMAHWYQDATLFPSPPPGGYAALRLIFMDMNLQDMTGGWDPKVGSGPILSVLEQVVSKDSGPYLLVFWTQVNSKTDDIASEIHKKLRNVPTPISISDLRKGPFLSGISSGRGDLREQLQSAFQSIYDPKLIRLLQEKILELTTGCPPLSVVARWETRASEAAASAVNGIFTEARAVDADPSHASESLTRILSSIAVEAAGSTNAKRAPAAALDAAMADILTDQFSISVSSPDYQKVVSGALGESIGVRHTFSNPQRLFARLNTYFQVERNVAQSRSIDRGVVLPADELLTTDALGMPLNNFLWSEFLYDPRKGEVAPPEHHKPTFQRLRDEFKALPENLKEAAAKSLDTIITNINKEYKTTKQRLKEAVPAVETDASFVLVEIGADCDHAQAKPRTLRYLVGVEIPVSHQDDFVLGGGNAALKHASLRRFGPYHVDGRDFYLLVSCRRYVVWQKGTPPAGKVKYRLRGPVVTALLHQYSSLSTRPGIVEFRMP